MRFPNHIVLDVPNSYSHAYSQYWIFDFFKIQTRKTSFLAESYSRFKLFSGFFKKNKLKNLTLSYSLQNPALLLTKKEIKMYKKLFATRTLVKNKLLFSKNLGKLIHRILTKNSKYEMSPLIRVFMNKKKKIFSSTPNTSNLWSLFNLIFLKKEKLYTKLKYSRTPQYDIVSGGVAALFAGFLGFLICEKFGLELLDSGDFYFLFMYMVFISFFSKLLINLINGEIFFWNIFSLKWFFYFYKTLVILISRFFNN